MTAQFNANGQWITKNQARLEERAAPGRGSGSWSGSRLLRLTHELQDCAPRTRLLFSRAWRERTLPKLQTRACVGAAPTSCSPSPSRGSSRLIPPLPPPVAEFGAPAEGNTQLLSASSFIYKVIPAAAAREAQRTDPAPARGCETRSWVLVPVSDVSEEGRCCPLPAARRMDGSQKPPDVTSALSGTHRKREEPPSATVTELVTLI